MAPSVQTPFSQALNAVTNGNVLLPLFKANHITSCAQLLAWAPSFLAAAVLDSNDVLAMHLALEQASTTPQLPAWPTDSTKGARYIRTIVIAARGLLASETSATVPAGAAPQLVQAPNAANTTTAGNNTVAGSANAEALSAKGQKLYDLAALMYGSTGTGAIKLEAEHHVKYEIIGRLNAAALARRPAALPLADFHLELAVQHGKEETYTAFGQQWVSRESSDKSVKIVDEATLLSMMQRRATAYAVSGAWDFPAHLVAKGLPAPLYPQKLSDSGIVYVDNGKVVSIDAFATPAGQMLEIEAMRDFRRRHPHVPIAKCVTIIDAGVQRAIANLLLKNYSRDAAVFQSCVRSTELYSLTLVQGNDNSSTEGTAETNGTTGDKNNKKQKTDAEARQAAERKIDQMSRQIDNLKSGKGRGGNSYGNGGGRGGGGGGFGAAYQQRPGGPPAPAGPAGNGWSKIQCPPDVCRDFNFKTAGCARGGACKMKHHCAQCSSSAHGYIGGGH